MTIRYMNMLIGGIIGVAVASFIVGEIQWILLIGFIIGISIAEVKKRSREKTGEVETDERVADNSRKFMLFVMGASLFLLLIYLVIAEFILNQQVVEIRYLTYYVLATFLISLFIGPMIIKRR